jgi:hypothetical protein
MQRINYFTNPNFTGPFADVNISGEVKASYNADTKQLNIYGNNGGYGFNLTVPKNAALVFACFLWTEHDKNPKPLTVYSLESSDTKPIAYATVSQNANNLLLRFNSTGSGRIRVEFYPNGSAANIANPILELADTYDKAVGGASGLLLRRHDATRIGASVGRVMSDDNHEPMPEPNLDHHLESQQLGASHDRSEREIYDILGQFRYERHRRHCLDYRNTGRIQRTPTCQLHDVRRQFQSAISELFRQVRQSDRHRDKYTPLHVGRVSGEQDPARRHRIFHRGYDAARLTPLGVVA